MKILISTIAIFFLIGFFSPIGEAIKLEELLLYLSFDEGSGDKAEDLSENGFDGKLNGPKWVLGKFGKALEFDGKDDFVAVEPIGVDPDEITIELWFNPAKDIDSSSSRMDLVYALKGCCRPCVIFNREKDGGMGFYPEYGEGAPNTGPMIDITSKTSSWKAGSWYHFVGTTDEKEVKVYVDGNLEKTMKAPGIPTRITYKEHGISIGANQGKSNFFSGKIDELRIWSRVLTDDEIRKAFAGTLLSIEPKQKISFIWGLIKK